MRLLVRHAHEDWYRLWLETIENDENPEKVKEAQAAWVKYEEALKKEILATRARLEADKVVAEHIGREFKCPYCGK